MKRLNPIYILLLMVTVLFVSFISLKDEKKKFEEQVKDYENISLKSKEYKELKSYWDNEKYVEKTLDTILKSRDFRDKKVLRVKVNKSIKVKLESQDPKVLGKFLNRVLNKKLIIKNLVLDKTYISLEIGVR